MKVLVGLMYCGENEYENSQWSLQQQSYTNYDVFKVEKLPNKEAHDTMYGTFMANAGGYDLFMKLDADMVLCRTDFLERAVGVFRNQPQIDDLQIGVHDFFTDRLIYGLHLYSNRVKWGRSEEKVFVDMIDQRQTRAQDMKVLAPAAWHCPNPSDIQAFHFGVHKAIKILQIGALQPNPNNRKVHTDNILKVMEQWKKRQDRRLAYAAIGGLLGLVEKVDYRYSDYESKAFRSLYDPIKNLALEELHAKMKNLLDPARTVLNGLK